MKCAAHHKRDDQEQNWTASRPRRLFSGAPSSQLSLQDYGLQEILNGRLVQNRVVFVVDDATVAFISSVVDNT